MINKTFSIIVVLIALLCIPSNSQAAMNRYFYIISEHTKLHALELNKPLRQTFITDENFGIVGVKFDTGGKSIQGEISFTLSEEGSDSHLYKNTYKTDQFQHQSYFPFGFPLVINEKENVYEFELEMLSYMEPATLSAILSTSDVYYEGEVQDDRKTSDILFYLANEKKFTELLFDDIKQKYINNKLFYNLYAMTLFIFGTFVIVGFVPKLRKIIKY